MKVSQNSIDLATTDCCYMCCKKYFCNFLNKLEGMFTQKILNLISCDDYEKWV